MYMPGRRRTASRPSRTWMSAALYDREPSPPVVLPFAVFTALTAIASPLRATGADQQLVQPLEVLVGVELDRDPTALATPRDLDLRAQRAAQLGRDAGEIRIVAACASPPARMRWTHHLACQRLGLPDRHALREDLPACADRLRKW